MAESPLPLGGRRIGSDNLAAIVEGRDESRLRPLEQREAQAQTAQIALAQLLCEQGLYCGQDDVVVKVVISRAGRAYYVVIALNGTERPVAEAISRITPRAASSRVSGVWVQRPDELNQLLAKEVGP